MFQKSLQINTMVILILIASPVFSKTYGIEDVFPCPKDEALVCDSIGNPITGIFVHYYPTGILGEEINFKDGKLDGLSKSYYKNSSLKSTLNFKDGRQEGLARFYYESGNLKSELNFDNGKLKGVQKSYYEDGNIKEEILYKGGKPVSGYVHTLNGTKSEMSDEILHDIKKNFSFKE